MPEQIQDNVFLDRFVTLFATTFALLATLLAAVGLYGVLAYTVAQRTREVRRADGLGAGPAQVRSMVLRAGGQDDADRRRSSGSWRPCVIGRVARVAAVPAEGERSVGAGARRLWCSGWWRWAPGWRRRVRASRLDPVRALRYE